MYIDWWLFFSVFKETNNLLYGCIINYLGLNFFFIFCWFNWLSKIVISYLVTILNKCFNQLSDIIIVVIITPDENDYFHKEGILLIELTSFLIIQTTIYINTFWKRVKDRFILWLIKIHFCCISHLLCTLLSFLLKTLFQWLLLPNKIEPNMILWREEGVLQLRSFQHHWKISEEKGRDEFKQCWSDRKIIHEV